MLIIPEAENFHEKHDLGWSVFFLKKSLISLKTNKKTAVCFFFTLAHQLKSIEPLRYKQFRIQ